MKLKWKRSDEGYTDTHCGRYSISPQYWGRSSPQGFLLMKNSAEGRVFNKRLGEFETQRDAKLYAQAWEDARAEKPAT